MPRSSKSEKILKKFFKFNFKFNLKFKWRRSELMRLTICLSRHLVKDMKISDKMIQRLVQSVFRELKQQNSVQFKEKEDKVFQRACEIIKNEYHKEAQLDDQVQKMMDDLERQNPGEFQRYKMFPLLKKRLAKEKGIIL